MILRRGSCRYAKRLVAFHCNKILDGGWFVFQRRCHTNSSRKGGRHLDEVAFVTTAGGTNASHCLAVQPSKPLKGVLEVPSVTTTWAPNKHTRDGLVTNEAHRHASTTALTDLPCRITAQVCISRGLDGLSASWTRFVNSVAEMEISMY